MPLAPVPATRVPRSALTFSSDGDLGVRVVGAGDKVRSCRCSVVEDEQGYMWVTGVADGARVIVQGQDFVREGQKVDAVARPSRQLTAVTARRELSRTVGRLDERELGQVACPASSTTPSTTRG